MRKVRLNLEMLSVESFHTLADGVRDAGTVHAHNTDAGYACSGPSYDQPCEPDLSDPCQPPTAVSCNSCYNSCLGTCGYSCASTCAGWTCSWPDTTCNPVPEVPQL